LILTSTKVEVFLYFTILFIIAFRIVKYHGKKILKIIKP